MESAPEKMQPPPPTIGQHCKRLVDKTKLVLCHVCTSKVLISHCDLKYIMESCGFVCLADPEEDANSAWVEYSFPAAGDDGGLPTPTLPGNRVDGLHIYTYRAFLDAVNHYLRMDSISDLFTIQSIPVRCPPDARLTWRLAEVNNQRFVYRAQTLKQEVFDFYDRRCTHGSSSNAGGSGEASSSIIHSTGADGSNSSRPVHLKDSVVTDDQDKNDSPEE